VRKSQEYIRAGDIFQVVLSQRLSVPFRARPVDVYRALRALNPSPYMYFIDLGATKVVGASPEILVSVKHGEVTIRPLAGTRRRGATATAARPGRPPRPFAVREFRRMTHHSPLAALMMAA